MVVFYKFTPREDSKKYFDEVKGGSCIINPYGEYVAGPLFDQAGILTAEIDLDQIVQSKFDWDPVGHYNRPEILKFEVNEI